MYNVIIIDDSRKLCLIIQKDFELLGHSAFYATNSTDAIEILNSKKIDVILLDLKLSEENGMDVLLHLKHLFPDIPVIMITGHGTISNAVDAIKNGAYDYLQKPVNFEKLLKVIENATCMKMLKEENRTLKSLINSRGNDGFYTVDYKLKNILQNLIKIARTKHPVLITGESGTGKELIAEFIHAHSVLQTKELYTINCAAFSETLLDDELFGHNKGAFTGADSNFKGVFERANNSTLFLDELGDMPLSIQAKILRTLQNKEVRRLGSDTKTTIDVRFIAATNKDINQMVSEGNFREDLFFRMNTFQIHLPPLRERTDDILFLSKIFLKESAERTRNQEKALSEKTQKLFKDYPWPGNVRELKNVLDYAVVFSDGTTIHPEDLPEYLKKSISVSNTIPHDEISEIEKIKQALNICKNNKSKAAEYLKISRRTLYNKIEKLSLNV